MLPVAEFAFDVGEAQADEIDVLAPGFADVALHCGFTGFAMKGGVLGDLTGEDRRRFLQVIAE